MCVFVLENSLIEIRLHGDQSGELCVLCGREAFPCYGHGGAEIVKILLDTTAHVLTQGQLRKSVVVFFLIRDRQGSPGDRECGYACFDVTRKAVGCQFL